MPTYRYVCDSCGESVEYFQSMSEGPKRKCPACGRLKLQRQIGGGAAILFKGSGFYETDYRSSSYKEGAAAEKKSAEKKEPTSKDSGKGKSSGEKGGASTGDD